MQRLILFFITGLIFLNISLFAQTTDFGATAVEKRYTHDVKILSSDSMLGREAGTEGEWRARHYIASKYEEIGLKPMFISNTYFQKFTYEDNPYYGKNNELTINGQKQELYFDYYAVNMSGSDSISGDAVYVGYGISALDQGYDDYTGKSNLEGKIFIINLSIPEGFESNKYILSQSGKHEKVSLAIRKGAIGVIFIRPDEQTGEPDTKMKKNDVAWPIPVVYLRNNELISKTVPNSVNMRVNIIRESSRDAYNVAGYIDNGATQWVVIGAHYDHLGFDMSKIGEPSIFNGADDNATGTAAVIEIARYVTNLGLKNYNYIFVAFSAEEKGLIGSKFFTNSKVVSLDSINYMINLDMIGNMNSSRKLNIFGVGNSVRWRPVIDSSNTTGLAIKYCKSGVGGSDHISFYYKNIPDIFFNTKIHSRYHTPEDDNNKLNYKGAIEIIELVERIITTLDEQNRLPFRRTSGWSAFWGQFKLL